MIDLFGPGDIKIFIYILHPIQHSSNKEVEIGVIMI